MNWKSAPLSLLFGQQSEHPSGNIWVGSTTRCWPECCSCMCQLLTSEPETNLIGALKMHCLLMFYSNTGSIVKSGSMLTNELGSLFCFLCWNFVSQTDNNFSGSALVACRFLHPFRTPGSFWSQMFRFLQLEGLLCPNDVCLANLQKGVWKTQEQSLHRRNKAKNTEWIEWAWNEFAFWPKPREKRAASYMELTRKKHSI